MAVILNNKMWLLLCFCFHAARYLPLINKQIYILRQYVKNLQNFKIEILVFTVFTSELPFATFACTLKAKCMPKLSVVLRISMTI